MPNTNMYVNAEHAPSSNGVKKQEDQEANFKYEKIRAQKSLKLSLLLGLCKKTRPEISRLCTLKMVTADR
jgi:hypothetical protein